MYPIILFKVCLLVLLMPTSWAMPTPNGEAYKMPNQPSSLPRLALVQNRARPRLNNQERLMVQGAIAVSKALACIGATQDEKRQGCPMPPFEMIEANVNSLRDFEGDSALPEVANIKHIWMNYQNVFREYYELVRTGGFQVHMLEAFSLTGLRSSLLSALNHENLFSQANRDIASVLRRIESRARRYPGLLPQS